MNDYFDLHADKTTLDTVSALGLAHLGDAVFELMVRSYVCLHGRATAKGLHKAVVGYVAAPAQAGMAEHIKPLLTEAECDVFRRGRNASPHTIPQHASREEYATATALEALFGWLWLQGKKDRLNELFGTMMEVHHGT